MPFWVEEADALASVEQASRLRCLHRATCYSFRHSAQCLALPFQRSVAQWGCEHERPHLPLKMGGPEVLRVSRTNLSRLEALGDIHLPPGHQLPRLIPNKAEMVNAVEVRLQGAKAWGRRGVGASGAAEVVAIWEARQPRRGSSPISAWGLTCQGASRQRGTYAAPIVFASPHGLASPQSPLALPLWPTPQVLTQQGKEITDMNNFVPLFSDEALGMVLSGSGRRQDTYTPMFFRC